MPIYRYLGLDGRGKRQRGTLLAPSLALAKKQLESHITLLNLTPHTPPPTRLNASQLLTLTKQLAQLLEARFSLYDSLTLLEEQQRNSPLHPLLLTLCEQLANGHSLASTLRHQRQTFDPLYCALIESAEASGQLKETFTALSTFLSKQLNCKKQLLSALLYPALLFGLWLLVVAALLLWMLPTLQQLLPDSAAHPLPTLSNTCHPTLKTLALLLPAAALCYHKSLWTHLPWLKNLLIHRSLLHLASTLTMLLTAGLPLLTALPLARKVVPLPQLQTAIARIEQRLLAGEQLTTGLQQEPLFPPLFVKTVALGEAAGQLERSFASLASLLEEELTTKLNQLQAVLQPLLLVLLAILIGITSLAMLLPLTEMSTLLDSL